MTQLSGKVINGRYRIINTVGIGGMSVVFRAFDLQEEREVSLKVLRADRLGDKESRRRFYNESRAISLMSHPNIVNVYDVNFEGKIQYIVMEYVDGVTLKDRMDQKGRLSHEEAIFYLKQVLSALSHAHSRGVVHHDIKPQNILLLEDGSVKVTDFGIASVPNFEDDSPSDEAVGSVHYISPEQALGEATDEKSDIYSVGVMMYAIFTGRLPFDAHSPLDVARMQVEKPPYPPCKLVEDLPIGFQQMIFRAMAKNPAHRYQNAAALLTDLEELEENPKKVFPYPKDFRLARKKKPNRNGVTGFFRSFFPDDDDVYRTSRNRLIFFGTALLSAFLVIFICSMIMNSVVSNRYKEYVSVPSYLGMVYEQINDADAISENFDLQVEYRYDGSVEAGLVIEQNPQAGVSVPSGTKLTIVVSKSAETVTVPEGVLGKTRGDAEALLKNSRLTPSVVTVVDPLNEGKVISCNPSVGSEVTEWSTVVITVGVAPSATALMPDVVDLPQDEAIAKLYAAGISNINTPVTEYHPTVPSGYVISQSIPANTALSVGESVTIVVSKGPEAR